MSGLLLYISLAIATLAVSWAAIIIRMAQADPISIAFYRMTFAFIMMAPFALPGFRTAFRRLRSRDLLWLAGSGVALGLHFAFWITSLSYTTISNSVVIVATQPFFVAGMEAVLWKETIGRKALIGMMLAFAGIVIISGSDIRMGHNYLIGDLFALIGALCAGIYLMLGRRIRQTLDNRHYVFPVHVTAAVTLLVVALFSGSPLSGFPRMTWFWFIILALIPTIMGHTMYNYLLKFIRAHLVAITILGEPIGATIFAAIIFLEFPPSTTYLGGGLILTGIVVALLKVKSDPGLAETA